MKDMFFVKLLIIFVVEFIINFNIVVNIIYFFGRVKEVSICLGSRSVCFVRIEVDFLWLLINFILFVFNVENMVKYF